MASATGAELQNRQLLGFCEVPSISAVPGTGNLGNPQGICKWLPQLKRTLQNRQLLGFCEVPSISAVPKARKSKKSTRGLGHGFRKRRTLQNRQLLGFCEVPSISAVPEAGNQSSDRIRDISSRCLHLLPPCDLPALPTLRIYRHHRPESANDADTAIARCTSVRANRVCLAGGKYKATTSVDRLVADTTAKQLRYLPAQMENFLGSCNSAAFIV